MAAKAVQKSRTTSIFPPDFRCSVTLANKINKKSIVESMLDEYEIKARVAPALLVTLPAGIAALAYFGVDFGLEAGFIAAGLMLGGGVLTANWIADRGGAKEQALLESWQGMPSVQLLRHRDPTIAENSKQRIHTALSKKAELKMPCASEELADPGAADGIYRNASDWLRTNTRSKDAFPTVFARNCEYGFSRNAFGATSWAMGVGTLVAIVVLAVDLTHLESAANTEDRLLMLTPGALTTLLLVGIWIVIWNLYFTVERVRQAAYAYGRALLEQAEAFAHE
jgi:hypothetical protein